MTPFSRCWSDPAHGVLATDDGVLRTTDGGGSWSNPVSERCYRIDFRNPLQGVVGSSTYERVWITADGGETWEMVEYPWAGSPRDVVSFDGGFGVCGLASVILLGTEVLDPASIEEGGSAAVDPATRFEIIKTSPNPNDGRFHLTIRDLVAGPVQLRVLDVAGREVGVLHHTIGGQSASIPWDLRGLTGGLYFVEASLPSGAVARGRFVISP